MTTITVPREGFRVTGGGGDDVLHGGAAPIPSSGARGTMCFTAAAGMVFSTEARAPTG